MARKTNLLFILTDQQRSDTMECYGNSHIRTPSLNSLARASSVFENAYVSQPVCTPSRVSILTGLYPQTHGLSTNGIPLGSETRTIAEMVSEEYVCGYYGKWHLGDELRPQHGFDWWRSMEEYRGQYFRSEDLSRFSDYHHFLIESGFKPDTEGRGHILFSRRMAAKLPEKFTKARWLGREAARFIRENKRRPFVLYVSFLEPHMPYDGPLNDMCPRDWAQGHSSFESRPRTRRF